MRGKAQGANCKQTVLCSSQHFVKTNHTCLKPNDHDEGDHDNADTNSSRTAAAAAVIPMMMITTTMI